MSDNPERYADYERGIRVWRGREMRGGQRGGHTHVCWSSRPVLKGPGTWADCPACIEWAAELALADGADDGS